MATSFLVPKNQAESTLDGGIADDALSLDVASGGGAKFPSTYPFHITIDDEILVCTNRATDTLTVTRAAEGTAAAAHLDTAVVSLNITAQIISDLNAAVNTLEGYCPSAAVLDADFNANTILYATDNDTPLALAVGEQTLVGRKTGGAIAALAGADVLLAMGISATIAELNLLDLAGLTAGEVLRATGAAAAGWGSDGVVLTAPTLNGTTTLGSTPIFDVGSESAEIDTTGLGKGLIIQSTQDGSTGSRLYLKHVTSSPVDNDKIGQIMFWGKNDAAQVVSFAELWGVAFDVTDGAEEGGFNFYGYDNGAQNQLAILSGAGVLDVDASSGLGAATVGEFDDLDDALILKQGISEKQLEVLEKIGVMKRKDTGSGWMLSIQAMCYLLAGGIYQNRARIDSLNSRLGKLELALPIGG